MGAYEALKEAGLRIPEDVAVVGFDNQELIAAQLWLALSTIALPHYEMGRWAVNYLIEQAQHGEIRPVQHTIAFPYVGRESARVRPANATCKLESQTKILAPQPLYSQDGPHGDVAQARGREMPRRTRDIRPSHMVCLGPPD
jgi:Periplasmic binding protein-like domain